MCCMPEKIDSGDLSWPELDPDPYLEWHLCSQGILTRPLRLFWLIFEQKLSILPALGFSTQERKKMTFDLTLTRGSRSIVKSQVCFGENSWRTFKRRLAVFSTIGSRGGRGRQIPPPPTTGGREYGNAPGGAGLTMPAQVHFPNQFWWCSAAYEHSGIPKGWMRFLLEWAMSPKERCSPLYPV